MKSIKSPPTAADADAAGNGSTAIDTSNTTTNDNASIDTANTGDFSLEDEAETGDMVSSENAAVIIHEHFRKLCIHEDNPCFALGEGVDPELDFFVYEKVADEIEFETNKRRRVMIVDGSINEKHATTAFHSQVKAKLG